MKMTPEQVCQVYDTLKGKRGTWETHWQDVLDYHQPNVQDVITKRTPGQKKGIELFDNTGMVASEELATALQGILVSPNTTWFELGTADTALEDNDEVLEYLQWMTRKVHQLLNNTNFQTEIGQFFLDLCTIGSAIMIIEKNDQKIMHFSTKHIAECVIRENRLGLVDELHRRFKWTASQVIENFVQDIFGKDVDVEDLLKNRPKDLEEAFSRELVEAYKNHKPDEFEIQHSIYKSDALLKVAQPFASQYILLTKKEKKELRFKGFRTFPAVVSRWTKTSCEVYGRSPAMKALPEMKTLNSLVKSVIKGAQKTVDPPTQGPDDGFLRPLKTAPGSHHYYRAGTPDRIEAIFKDVNPRIGLDLLVDRRDQVRKAFYVDKLNLLQQDRMTTVETNQRIQEQYRFLSPMIGRQRFEVLVPMIDRIIDIIAEADAGSGQILGEVPAELQDALLSVEYTSPIARAQIMREAENMIRALEASAPFIELDQSSRDLIDSSKAIKFNWQRYGAPLEVLRNKKELKEVQEARQAAQEEALERQKQMEDAEKASKLKGMVPTA